MATTDIRKMEPDIETASQMLSNIFDELDLQPSSVSLEVMSSYSSYRRERYTLQKIILIVVLAAFLLVPLFFIGPKISIREVTGPTVLEPFYEVTVKSVLPVSSVTAMIDDYSFAVTENGGRVYTVKPTINGTLDVKVKLANFQYGVAHADVKGIDTETPIMLPETFMDEGVLTLYLEDKDSGVNLNEVYAMTLDNIVLYPSSINEAECSVTFLEPSDSMNIFVPDRKGNVLHLVLTLK